MAFIELTGASGTVRLTERRSELAARTIEALDGWYSTPDSKVESTERQSGHGAFNITDDMVLYSARTVTIDLVALGNDRAEVMGIMERVQRMAGQMVQLRVVDADRDTYATGYIELGWDAARYSRARTGTITVVCPDPRRYATEAHSAFLSPMTGADGGFMFDSGTGVVLSQPFRWYGDPGGGNAATLENNGTSTAYPVITISGHWPNGVTITTDSGKQLSYGAGIYYQNVVLDSLSRTASINGVDVTRNLTSRDFPTVEPGETVRLSCMSAGTGGIEVSVRDTYI